MVYKKVFFTRAEFYFVFQGFKQKYKMPQCLCVLVGFSFQLQKYNKGRHVKGHAGNAQPHQGPVIGGG